MTLTTIRLLPFAAHDTQHYELCYAAQKPVIDLRSTELLRRSWSSCAVPSDAPHHLLLTVPSCMSYIHESFAHLLLAPMRSLRDHTGHAMFE
eukprot:46391-Eustigmatos_ZCMA.PRE.1